MTKPKEHSHGPCTKQTLFISPPLHSIRHKLLLLIGCMGILILKLATTTILGLDYFPLAKETPPPILFLSMVLTY